jgi:2-oxoglutarate dehydrogenase E2 component (dihydrolipoamide succinyltransferase)
MPVEIRVPAMGESVTEAVVGQWLKKPGEAVGADEAVVTLETDKVAVDVPAEQAGILASIQQQEGATVHVGDVLAILTTADEPAVAGVQGAPTATAAAPPSAQGATATVIASAPESTQSVPAASIAENGASATRTTPPATPVAQRLAAEKEIDLAQVSGTGPRGRVTRDDVAAYVGRAPQSVQAPVSPPPAPPVVQAQAPVAQVPALAAVPAALEERVRMTRRRQTIARRLVEAQHTAAMLTTFNEIDMSSVMEVRKRRRDSFKERHGVGLGFMSFFTKAVIGALKAFPHLNAEIQGDEIVVKHYYHIGIAVGVEEGLVVPVLRDADRKSFAQIEREIADMAGRARQNKLTLAELQGSTFTITNGGIFGSLLSTPILNTPEVGILGMHKIEERPIALNGQVVIRPMMYVALSYDHRIVDGSEAVRFLVRVKELIEDPEALLLEG